MPKLIKYLEAGGVEFKKDEEVQKIRLLNGYINEIETANEKISADEFILAAGTWSSILAKKLGVDLPLQPGKGYSINVCRKLGIGMPAILMESSMAVTPMNQFTRFAGTMEFSGINSRVRKERVDAIAKGAQYFYPEVKISEDEKSSVKTGMRPVSPDGLPYIGRSSQIKNLIFATGHAMMGWSLGPATGKLVSEIVDNRKTSMNISSFVPERKF